MKAKKGPPTAPAPKRPRGRPRKTILPNPAQKPPAPSTAPPPTTAKQTTTSKVPDRSSRLSALLAPKVEVIPVKTNEIVTPEKATTPKAATATRRPGWKNLSRKIVIGVDAASSFAIEHLTDREPLDPSEEATEELEEEISAYGRQKLGEVDLPLWLTLVLALIAFAASKYIGAPKKPKEITTDKPKDAQTTTAAQPAQPAALPITPAPDAATPAASQPRPSPPADDGNVGLVETGW